MSNNLTELVDRYLEGHPGITRDEAEQRVRRNHEVKLRLQQRVVLVDQPTPTKMAQPDAAGDANPREPEPEPPKRKSRHTETRRGLKMFKPLPWFGHYEPLYYVRHILMELGRLGMDIHDLGRRADRGAVLHDLLDWISDQGNEATLYNWRNLNLDLLLQRAAKRQFSPVKPRINLFAYITARGNLSVLWYPTGWRENHWDAEKKKANCDFLFFDDDAMMFDRPPNELMFIHGVTDLRPHYGIDHYGPYLEHNQWVLDALLICAVRAAYESLIERLKANFELNVRRIFVFQEDNGHVVDWTLEDPMVVQRRNDQKAFARIPSEFGFTVEQFDEAIRIASQPKTGSNERPASYQINEKLARNLKKAGYSVTPSVVERLRALINRVRSPEHNDDY